MGECGSAKYVDAKNARVSPTRIGIPIAFVVNWAGLISYKSFIFNLLELDHDECLKDQELEVEVCCAYESVSISFPAGEWSCRQRAS